MKLPIFIRAHLCVSMVVSDSLLERRLCRNRSIASSVFMFPL